MALKLTPIALALVGTAVVAGAGGVLAQESHRGNDTLKKYCTGDYLQYCGNLAPDDPATDECFRTNWKKLSENCRRAIDAYVPPQTKSPKRS